MRLGELTLVCSSCWAGDGERMGRGELGRWGRGWVGRWLTRILFPECRGCLLGESVRGLCERTCG